jgi:microcystin-dependent protein
MGTPYVGEIRIFAGNFAPAGWAFCNGVLLPISENEVLFQLIGTTYGGDGQSTFSLPDLQGRVPVHQGNGHVMGERSGTETVTLTVNQIPAHTHTVAARSGAGNQTSPAGNLWAAAATGAKLYSSLAPTVNMNPSDIGSSGGSQPHENRMPFLAVSFIISLFGIFPSQN